MLSMCRFDGSDHVAHSLGGGASRRRDFLRLSLDPTEKVQADRLVDFGFLREEAIDVGGLHPLWPSSNSLLKKPWLWLI
jgi:hypothetical protein